MSLPAFTVVISFSHRLPNAPNTFSHRLPLFIRAMQPNPFQLAHAWEDFKGLFRGLHQASEPLRLPAYNGGLFKHDLI